MNSDRSKTSPIEEGSRDSRREEEGSLALADGRGAGRESVAPSAEPPGSDRARTDESLRVERTLADGRDEASAAIEAADEVLSLARSRADEVLAAARAKTDSGSAGAVAPAPVPESVVKERVLEDHVIEEARAAEDETLHEDRVRQVASVSSHRDETDKDLSYERAQATSGIAELKGVEKTLEGQNIEIQAANRAKSEFVADMSHELRGPLHAIIGFSEVLKDGLVGEMTDQQHQFVGDILSSSNHLLAVVNDVLDLSKVEAGRMVLELEPVLVSALVERSVPIVRESAAAHQIRIELVAAEGLGWMRADVRKVRQILYNLLSNAVKFTADGGVVTVRTDLILRTDIAPRGSSTAGSVTLSNEFEQFLRISVTDSGMGISPNAIGGLFSRFRQLDGAGRADVEGTGLGLVMVKLFAALHGGAVTVESVVGKGSCFTVYLPYRVAEAL